MTFRLRTPAEADWDTIFDLALAAVPWDIKGNKEWLANRKKFDGRRVHHVAESSESGTVVAYGGIEEGLEDGIFRIFVVMDAGSLRTELGDLMFEQLVADLRGLNVHGFWAREYSRDDAIVPYFIRHGMVEKHRFTLEGHEEMIVLTGSLESE